MSKYRIIAYELHNITENIIYTWLVRKLFIVDACKLHNPVTVIPGLISVEYVSFTSPCSILAMPISIILSLAGLRPVVSRSSAI